MKAKYIILERSGIEMPILFPEFIEHIDAVLIGGKVISAGFFEVILREHSRMEVRAYGESISLKVKARFEDADLIEKMICNYEN
jgi:hypothetical protein